MPPPIEFSYQPVLNHPHPSVGLRICWIVLTIAVAYGLFFQLSPDAPMWEGTHPAGYITMREGQLDALGRLIELAGNGHNIQIRFDLDATLLKSAKIGSEALFAAVYAEYPCRVVLGADQTVVNGLTDPAVLRAGLVTDAAVAKELDVKTIVEIREPGEVLKVRPVR